MHRRTTVLLLCTALTALPVRLALADDGDGQVVLPGVPERLSPQQACTTAEGRATSDAPWTRQALGLDQVWTLSQGRGVTVAIVGTGVSDGPAVLAGRVDAVGDADDDCVGRGTFQAGLVAGAATPGQGFAGVAPQARILAVRGTGVRGESDPARLAAGVRAAAERGAGVIVVSAPLNGADKAVRAALAVAEAKDSLVVAPAAADSVPLSTGTDAPAEPAPAPPENVLAVLDTGPQGTRPDSAPPYTRADLTAPGDALVGPGPVGGGMWTGSGASLAAAVTAGAAALVRSYHPELNAAQVRERLLRTAYPADLPALDPYGAVAGAQAPAVRAAADRPDPVRLVPPPDSGGARNTALLVTVGAAGVALLVAFLAVVLPRGRARGWRPGRVGAGDAHGRGGTA
ncbi:S8 family serine peptidase [Streptomyces sp. NBC_00102]|uniref:S8 family serine peptidase n=1 Tax=Streptomyces sp. NBC_00102 TaxID=2975652 RepID=UPI002252CD92|nr:S8 family serine peptidase [Streptomyces sp. NBC_00102]MCX5401759.1 S8 family serine peptidase [Streptomyces sp. NBC_00102]